MLLAAFANSPRLHGRRTGWKSSRWACWMRADPARTAPPPPADTAGADPAAAWARRVLHSPVLCVRRGGQPGTCPERMTFADWIDGALPGARPPSPTWTTTCPPCSRRSARAGTWRSATSTASPGRRWALPPAVLAALLSDAGHHRPWPARPANRPEGRWVSAARHGLADRVLARAAGTVFELACAQLAGARRARRG